MISNDSADPAGRPGPARTGRKRHSHADSTVTYRQDVEPPVDADVTEWGGHSPRWSWGTARGPAIGVVLAALAVGLLLGFAGDRVQSGQNGRPAPAATSAGPVLPGGL